MESFGKILAVMLAALLLVLAPVQALAQSQVKAEKAWYEEKVRVFTEEIAKNGYLSMGGYEQFRNTILKNGNLWEIELTHAREKSSMVLETSNTMETRKIQQVSAGKVIRLGTGRNVSHEHTADCYTHTHSDKTGSNGRYYCTHTHTDACQGDGWSKMPFVHCTQCNVNMYLFCYEYDKYGELQDSYMIYIPQGGVCPTCKSPLGSSSYAWEFYYSCGFSRYVQMDSEDVPTEYLLPEIGTTQSGWFDQPIDQYKYGCYQYSIHDHEIEGCTGYLGQECIPICCNTCDGLTGMVIYEYDSAGNRTNYFIPSVVAICCGSGSTVQYEKVIKDYKYLCGKTSGWELVCGKEVEAVTPVCDQVIVSISPKYATQTVYTGDMIDRMVLMTSLSGNTFEVEADTEFTTENAGTYTVTLSLEGYIDTAKTTGKETTTITVTVVPKEKTCVNGHTYLLNSDGSDPGCDVCRTTVGSIVLHWDANEMYKGDVLPLGGISVTYLDGHNEYLESGFEIDYDETATGTVSVEVRYQNGYVLSAILVKPNVAELHVSPLNQNVVKYQDADWVVIVVYEDGTSRVLENYSVTGILTDQVGGQTGSISYTEHGKTVVQTVKVNVLPLSASCAYGHIFDRDRNDVNWGCPECRSILTGIEAAPARIEGKPGDPLTLTVIALYQDGHTEQVTSYESDYNASKIGEQKVTICFGGKTTIVTVILTESYSCPNCNAILAKGTECKECQRTPVDITAEPQRQTVSWGEEPEFTVWIVYKDGHKEESNRFTSSFRQEIEGEQQVEIYCAGFSSSVVVEQQERDMILCPACSGKYKKEDYIRTDGLEGCPKCSRELVKISAQVEGGSVVTSGSTPKIRVVLHYQAGNMELIYSGYRLKNYDPMQLGTQQIQVWYQEKKADLAIMVVENVREMVCEKGHRYFLSSEGADPGCPVCCGIQSDRIYDYLDICYTEQILQELSIKGIYYMQEGDYFSVRLIKKAKSSAEMIAEIGNRVPGEVRNEICFSTVVDKEREAYGDI